MSVAICINAADPLKMGRIRYAQGNITGLAYPIASGWVPSVGSKLVLIRRGNITYYIGTTRKVS